MFALGLADLVTPRSEGEFQRHEPHLPNHFNTKFSALCWELFALEGR